MLDLSDLFTGPGIATIFAAGWDNSGNYVVSGSTLHFYNQWKHSCDRLFHKRITSVPVDPSLINITLDSNGGIFAVGASSALGQNFLDVRVDITGSGSGASVDALLNENGEVTSFIINNW